jgi:ATP-dependent DNA helicase RecQ
MILEGVTLVVSPLIALMKDQVDALQARGLPATFINSSLSEPEQRARIESLRRRAHKLVYIAPERFRSSRFTSAVQSIPSPCSRSMKRTAFRRGATISGPTISV